MRIPSGCVSFPPDATVYTLSYTRSEATKKTMGAFEVMPVGFPSTNEAEMFLTAIQGHDQNGDSACHDVYISASYRGAWLK
jgi:hypothetical protein